MQRPKRDYSSPAWRADYALSVIKALHHTSGEWAGQPFRPAPWQEARIIRPLFGTLRPDGYRQYRQAHIEIPVRNGKTELVAAFALVGLIADPHPDGSFEAAPGVYTAAGSREQAGLIFSAAASMVDQAPELRRRLRVIPSRKTILDRERGGQLVALSADAYTKHGLNAHMIIADELHAWPTRALWDALIKRMGSRRQPLLITITSMGDWDDTGTIYYERAKYARAVRDGSIIDDTLLPVIYETPEDADWQDEAVWRAANPAIESGFRSIDDLRMQARQARHFPMAEVTFRRECLNQRVSAAGARLVAMDAWDACSTPLLLGELAGGPCWAGLDMAARMDLCGLVAVFPSPSGPPYRVLPYAWLPRDSLRERSREEQERLAPWIRAGLLEVTEGAVVDERAIIERIMVLRERFGLRQVAMDWSHAATVYLACERAGIEAYRFPQGGGMMHAALNLVQAAVAGRELHHGGHPVLRWCVESAVVHWNPTRAMMQLVKPERLRDNRRVDLAIALAMALAGAIKRGGAEGPLVTAIPADYRPVVI